VGLIGIWTGFLDGVDFVHDTRDPGKSPPRDLAHDSSRDLRTLKQACDLTACDCGNLTHDLPRGWSST